PPQATARPGGAAPDYATWDQYLGGVESSQYSSLAQIDRDNVTRLQVAWTYPTGERGTYRFNPIVVDGVMYVLAHNNSIVALEADTGREIWRRPHEGAVGNRGISYWQSPDGSDRRLLYVNAGSLVAIDARSGEPIRSFGTDGRVDLRIGLDRDIESIPRLRTDNPGRIFE